MKAQKRNIYMNPYLGGLLIGILIIIAYYFAGEGLGSSGGFRDIAFGAIDTVAPEYAKENAFVAPHVTNEEGATHTWLVFELLGVIFGAIISAALYGRLGLSVGKAPHITNKKRLRLAVLGYLIA